MGCRTLVPFKGAGFDFMRNPLERRYGQGDLHFVTFSCVDRRPLLGTGLCGALTTFSTMIVEEYHGADARQSALNYFESKFQRREVPADAPAYRIAEPMWICELMKQLQFTPSTSEARRLVSQGAVRVDGRTITDVNFRFVPGEHKVLEVGKRRVARIEP